MKSSDYLKNKIVLITGGARGIGFSCAKAFLAQGAIVAICDIDQETGLISATELGENAHFYQLDVSNRQSFFQTVIKIENTLGPVDVLVNNAGIMPVGKLQEMSESIERQQIEVNLHGTLNGIHAVMPGMTNRNSGSIVNVASLAAKVPAPYAALYSSTKFAISGLTEALRYELKGTSVHLCIVYPSMVQTELVSGIKAPLFPSPVTPEQVANAVVKAVLKRSPRVYVPKMGGFLGFLPSILPDSIIHFLAKWTGLTSMFLNVDDSKRTDYRKRMG